jgi:hypothetical protein
VLSDLKKEISYRKEEESDPEQRKKSLKTVCNKEKVSGGHGEVERVVP